jgi:hypothetical protein
MKYKLLFLLTFLTLILPLGSSLQVYQERVPLTNASTLNVNNTQYFQGYTPSTLYTYYRGLLETFFDDVYCKLTGCTMTGNLNISANLSSDRYVTNLNTTTGICSNGTDTFFGYIEGVC